MSETTKIQWCDSTINFWSGCTKVSPGCANCYAEAMDKRHLVEKISHWGKGAPRLKSQSAVKMAFAMNRLPWICDGCGYAFAENVSPSCHCVQCDLTYLRRRRIFSLSRADWLDDEAPIEWLAEMLDTIRQCDQVIWILCTKRPELFYKRLSTIVGDKSSNWQLNDFLSKWYNGFPPENIILLASVENQDQADKRIPELLKIPAMCHGLSLEPLLGPVDLSKWFDDCNGIPREMPLDWLIGGGESGPGARPCNVEWIRSIVQQGNSAGVATFVKQLGAKPIQDLSDVLPESDITDESVDASDIAAWEYHRHNCPLHLRDKKGGDPAEWPGGLNVRQFPML